jgi:hypothetical protein
MEIRLLYFEGLPTGGPCTIASATRFAPRTRRTLSQSSSGSKTAEDAERLRFVGSPTILIDGPDPFAALDAPSA